MAGLLTWAQDPPALRRPLLIIALDGFVDAGDVAATAGMFLRHRWQSEPVARFDRDALIDFRARRPTVVIDNGVLRRVDWPDLQLFGARIDESERDVALLLGPEPDMRWEAFCAEVVDLCKRLDVGAVVGLGAYPAAAPHTRPIEVMRAGNSVAGGLASDVDAVTGYTGPVGVTTVLHAALAESDVPAVGLWAEVPHYIAGSPNPAGALALVQRVAAIVGVEVDVTELEAAAKLHVEQVDEAVADHPEAAEMVTALEHHRDSGDAGRLPTGEDIAAEIERFLRAQPE